MKRILAILLCLLMVCGLFAGCGMPAIPAMEEPEELKNAIQAELDCEIRNDEDGAFALFYPDSLTKEAFHQIFVQFQDYFPVQAGYTLKTVSWDTYQSTSVESHYTHRGEYLIETSGKQFHLFAALVSDDNGKGLKQWRLMNEADYQIYMESQKQG